MAVHIHASAEVSPLAHVGDGTYIWNNAQIREGVSIGSECLIATGVHIDKDVTIGNRCKIQFCTFIGHPAVLGTGVFVGPFVALTNDMNPRAVNPDMSLKTEDDWEVKQTIVDDGVSLGAGAIILPGIHIGKWAMIGAGALVTHDVPEYALMLGSPARQVGYVSPAGHKMILIAEQLYECPVSGFRLDASQIDPHAHSDQ